MRHYFHQHRFEIVIDRRNELLFLPSMDTCITNDACQVMICKECLNELENKITKMGKTVD